MSITIPRCAVVFKTYAWDGFVERQAHRLAEASGALDFFVSVDETNGSVGPVPFERVVRFTCNDLAGAGLPMRYAVGGVLWWNPDYAHYQFQTQYPDYDYYLFVEYDCVAQCSLEQFVGRAASQGSRLRCLADYTALQQMALDALSARCVSFRPGQARSVECVFVFFRLRSSCCTSGGSPWAPTRSCARGRAVRCLYRPRLRGRG